jgi:hypothetical protein
MAFNAWQKQEAEPEDHNSLCSAHGCPMEWTVEAGGRLCSYHAWDAPQEWPRITQGLKSRAVIGTLPTFAKSQHKQMPDSGVRFTIEQKRNAVNMLRNMKTEDPKAWAYKLRDREQAGEHLSAVQSSFWRSVLK